METIAAEAPRPGVPELRPVTWAMLAQALRRGWADLLRAPLWGLFFASVYVLIGWGLAWVTLATGKSYWLIFAALSFPLAGPFAVVASTRCRGGWSEVNRWTGARCWAWCWASRAGNCPRSAPSSSSCCCSGSSWAT